MPINRYRGPTRKLVLAIDVGTTYSGMAYALLDPGEVPMPYVLHRYPGQEHAASDAKVPSVMYYHPDGSVHSVGAETKRPGIAFEVRKKNLIFVEWFKIHLNPENMDRDAIMEKLPDVAKLPPNKTVVEVLGHFLSYLFSCARRFICETHGSGDTLWQSVEHQMDFVLSHPNGWGGLQQGKMRQAAVLGGLVPDTAAGHDRVHFVTEGEASLHFCIQSGLTTETLRDRKSVTIVDTGGGTVDISSYRFLSVSPTKIEEITAPDCLVQGSILVNVRATDHLKRILRNSPYGVEDEIQSMINYFDASTKPVFKDSKEASYIQFASVRANDPSVNIFCGQLMLSGEVMASFYQPCIDAIVDTVKVQRKGSKPYISTVFLVGGFASSPWLYSSLKLNLNKLGMTIYRPDTHTNKAVANGAVYFFLEHYVSARVMKMTYGTDINVTYEADNPEHKARSHLKIVRPSGRVALNDAFSTIIQKGTLVHENQEVSEEYFIETRDPGTLNSITADVMVYKGTTTIAPRWIDGCPELFTTLCTVSADTSQVPRRAIVRSTGTYYEQFFKLVLRCGLTEMKAQLSWMEKGVERRGPATIVYEPAVSR
ncbi:hypothetical protein OH76DRAFT_1485574 [Lentinus brumalis]|uniref:Actin-like ATPase domain-containing protein n=1 Tax=Lentinus brumalis TaxID=2498619 RepID=A0A371D1A9_9APHY|nr:hypothetical protein OH76DRAFT_1485574 [Polyporus brumalis]